MRGRPLATRLHLPRWRNRWRITGYILVTVLAVTAVAGTFAVQAVEREFTERVDATNRQQARGLTAAFEVIDPEVLERLADEPGFGVSEQATLLIGGSGRELALASGTVEDPDPLPDLGERSLPRLRATAGEPFEVDSADGSVSYRALATPLEDGRLVVVASPLRDRDAAIDVLRTVLFVAALVSTVVLTVTVSLVAGYVTRPLDAMIDTATEIGAGDLRARVPTEGVDDVARLATALNAMLDQLQHAFADKEASEEAMRRFVADASHELRTPLAAVLGYAELHQNRMIESPEQVDHAMGRIAAEGERMRLLVEELLLLARLDRQREARAEVVDLVQLASVAVADARAIAPDRPVTIDPPPGPVPVVGDPTSLRQALDNLLANTRAHTPEGTPVVVTVAAAGPTSTVSVADEGPGMEAADAARAFDRFFRAERSRARPGGSGLGLAIVAAIVEGHGGTVSVDTAPGHGATFTLTLPTAPTAPTATEPHPTEMA